MARSAKYAKTVAGADKPQRSARQKVHSLACWPGHAMAEDPLRLTASLRLIVSRLTRSIIQYSSRTPPEDCIFHRSS